MSKFFLFHSAFATISFTSCRDSAGKIDVKGTLEYIEKEPQTKLYQYGRKKNYKQFQSLVVKFRLRKNEL